MSDSVLHFLNLLWPHPPDGCLTLWRKNDRLSAHIPLVQLDTIVKKSSLWDQEELDVYYGVGLRTHGLAASAQGKGPQIVAYPGVFIDIDIAGPPGVHAATESLPPSLEAAAGILEHFPLEPSIVVHTGYGLHAYWLFEEASIWPLGGHLPIKTLLKQVQGRIVTRAKADGFHVDMTATVPRVLRLPGTRNWKRPESPQVVQILLDTGRRYSVEALEKASRSPSTPHGAAGPVETSPLSTKKSAGGASALPLPWQTELQRRLKKLTVIDHRHLMKEVFLGKSFAERGDRDRALQQVCSILAYTTYKFRPETTAEELAELLRPSLSVWSAEESPTKTLEEELAKSVEKLSRALEDAAKDAEVVKQAEEKIAQGLARALAKRGKKSGNGGPPNGHGGNGHIPGAPGAPGAQEGSSAMEASLSPEERKKLLRLAILQHKTSYYLAEDDSYTTPRTREELEVSIRDAFEKSPAISWYYDDANGVCRRKELRQFLNDYCTITPRVVCDLTIDRSYFDVEKQVFHEACAPMRDDLSPEFHPVIHEWLNLLGGAEAEKLLDWVATLTCLEWQTSALYCSGPSGTGKTLLTEGLAKLWKQGQATDMFNALGNFNADILNCPLIVADEHIPGKHTTAELRQLIGSSGRIINRKHLPTVPLHGSVRVMLLSNNDRMLQLGDDYHDIFDLEAVAGRFLHIETSLAAKQYLHDLGGKRTRNEGWVEKNLIAKHALWLAQNRAVVPGRRFLVEGHETRMHRQLLMQGVVSSLVLEWLARYLKSPNALGVNIRQQKGILFGDGRLLAKATVISDHWAQYVQSHNVPSLHRIGKALHSLSIQGQENRDYWVLNPDLVFEWSETHKIGERGEMEKLLNTPLIETMN